MARTADAIPERIDRLPMSRELWLVLGLAGIAWLVESFDIGLMGNVIPSLQKQYSLDAGMVGFLATASTLGIVLAVAPAGFLADRIGRKMLLVAGIGWFSLCSLASAFAPDPSYVVAFRFLGGLGMGMAFPIPYAIAAELVPGRNRGAATALLDAMLSVGYLLTSLAAFVLIPQLALDTGWRVLFLIGGLPLLYVPVLLRWMPESPRWLQTQGRTAEADRIVRGIEDRVEHRAGVPLPEPRRARIARQSEASLSPRWLFRGEYRKRTLMMWVSFACLLFMFYAIQTYMPTVLIREGHGVASAFLLTSLIISVSILGKALAAWSVEHAGRKPTILAFGLLGAASAVAFGFFHQAAIAVPLAMALSFFGIGVDPVVKVYGAEQYPTRLRETGIGLIEGVGRLFGGVLAPYIMSFLLLQGGTMGAYYFVGGVAIVGVLAVMLFGQETMGKSIEVASDTADVPDIADAA